MSMEDVIPVYWTGQIISHSLPELIDNLHINTFRAKNDGLEEFEFNITITFETVKRYIQTNQDNLGEVTIGLLSEEHNFEPREIKLDRKYAFHHLNLKEKFGK